MCIRSTNAEHGRKHLTLCSPLGGSEELLCEDVLCPCPLLQGVPVSSIPAQARWLGGMGTARGPLLWVSLCNRSRAAEQCCLGGDLAQQREGKYSSWRDMLPVLLTDKSSGFGCWSSLACPFPVALPLLLKSWPLLWFSPPASGSGSCSSWAAGGALKGCGNSCGKSRAGGKQTWRRGPAIGTGLFMAPFYPCSDAFCCFEPPTRSKATCSSFSSDKTSLLG